MCILPLGGEVPQARKSIYKAMYNALLNYLDVHIPDRLLIDFLNPWYFVYLVVGYIIDIFLIHANNSAARMTVHGWEALAMEMNLISLLMPS